VPTFDETLSDPDSRVETRPLAQGDVVGRYVVLAPVGHGGMGVVYAAYDPELDRKVALKLLHTWLSDGTRATDGHRRLLREAQAMAKLNHPNVITIHDVGERATDHQAGAGQVFLAMEFVEGHTIRDWLEAVERPWREILSVFLEAGHGLAAAHSKDLVHRDFKPENVMVGTDGGVRVMDFGLARPTGEEEASTLEARRSGLRPKNDALGSNLTAAGTLVGTPAYMAPEQHSGLSADAAADQFAFCVALWEALYGQRPFAGETVAALAFAVTQGTVTDPPAKSQVPRWVRQPLLRGLSVDPAGRFASIDQLLAALERDPTKSRRRWMTVGAVGLAAAALFAYPRDEAASPCASVGNEAIETWESAAPEVRQAFEASGLSYASTTLTHVSAKSQAWADAWHRARSEACSATLVRREQSSELMDRQVHCLERRRQRFNAVVQVLADADAEVIEKAAHTVAELPQLSKCADTTWLLARVKPPEDAATAAEVERLRGRLAEASALTLAGKPREALPIANAALEAAPEVGYDPVEAEALAQWAILEHRVGDPARGRDGLVEAYHAAARLRLDDIAFDAASELSWVAGVKDQDFQGGLQWVRHARIWSDATPRHEGALLEHRAVILGAAGRLEEELSAFEEAAALYEETVERDSTRLLTLEANHAVVLNDLGRYDEARPMLEHVLEKETGILGDRHPQVAKTLTNLANSLAADGVYAEAAKNLERALSIEREVFGDDHPEVAITASNLSDLFVSAGQGKEAEAHARMAVEILERRGPDNPELVYPLLNLGLALAAQERLDEAKALADRSIEIANAALGPTHFRVGVVLYYRGDLDQRDGDCRSALDYYRRSIAILEPSVDPGHLELTSARKGLAECEG
jgi:tetratricopeptide (TPR) repeat protein